MAVIQTITGSVSFKETEGQLTHLTWGDAYAKEPCAENITHKLQAYFNGKIQEFHIPLNPKGTNFQKKVWDELLTIPYGTTKSYKDIALALGSHPRAVGGAVGKNPIAIFIPCHRIIASNGKMCGFSGGEGIKTKEILLKLEQQNK